ncbi:hypothetical protein [Bacillus sp. IBL03825]|uniref:hypothetical protein n=1 Tax=Bacillus sp. IBL03825 TaxID=2953580 RepID=UPI00215818D5|nr:hypothetical protein [Bacillus sp. IBL03825]MCR6850507.1 hypothetical protein [Bacillus sp. IBL03825]
MKNQIEEQNLITNQEEKQIQNQIISQIMPIIEKLLTQLSQNPLPNKDNKPGNDNKFMEIDDIVDNLVNAGIITASNFNVNVELFRGSPITVSITNPSDARADVKKEVKTGISIKEGVYTEKNTVEEVQ